MSENFQIDKEKTKVYEKRSQRYQNTKDSAIALFIVGGFGLLFRLLILLQIIPIAENFFSFFSIASIVLCVVFIVLGILSLKKSFALKAEAEEEESFTAAISDWLENHIDSSIVAAEEDLSEADIYFLRCQRAKELILKEFPNMDEDYLDLILDENYDKLFEKK